MDYTSVSNPPSGFPNVGDSHIGFVGGLTYLNSQALATTAVTYAAGQVVGSLLTFPGLARVAGGSGLLQDVMIQSKRLFFRQMTLLLAQKSPLTITSLQFADVSPQLVGESHSESATVVGQSSSTMLQV